MSDNIQTVKTGKAGFLPLAFNITLYLSFHFASDPVLVPNLAELLALEASVCVTKYHNSIEEHS